MDMHLIVDIAHTLALVGLSFFYVKMSKELKTLERYMSTIARNPAKARRMTFEKFKNSEE